MKLSGLNTLITGGSQGLGRHVVEAFLAAGAHVTFCARTAADVETTRAALAPSLRPGQKLAGLACDVSDAAAVAALFARAAENGPLHAVVNNAGILRDTIWHKMSYEDWKSVIEVNLTGVFNVSKAATPYFREQQSGSFIHFTSTSGLIGS